MREVSKKVFEQKCRDGEWEAMSDVNRSGMVEVRVCESDQRKMVVVRNGD